MKKPKFGSNRTEQDDIRVEIQFTQWKEKKFWENLKMSDTNALKCLFTLLRAHSPHFWSFPKSKHLMAAKQARKNELPPDNHITNLYYYLKITATVMKENTGYHCTLYLFMILAL